MQQCCTDAYVVKWNFVDDDTGDLERMRVIGLAGLADVVFMCLDAELKCFADERFVASCQVATAFVEQ